MLPLFNPHRRRLNIRHTAISQAPTSAEIPHTPAPAAQNPINYTPIQARDVFFPLAVSEVVLALYAKGQYAGFICLRTPKERRTGLKNIAYIKHYNEVNEP
jgi:hypothetical protein